MQTTFSIREKSVEALGKEYPDYFIKKVSIESQKNLERPPIEPVLEESEHPSPPSFGGAHQTSRNRFCGT